MTADHSTDEHTAGIVARGDAPQGPTRVERLLEAVDPLPVELNQLNHAHGEGLICLLCAGAKSFRAALEAAGDEHHVCDDCLALYSPEEGCVHSRFLCGQCLTNCRDCVDERRDDSAAEVARDRWMNR